MSDFNTFDLFDFTFSLIYSHFRKNQRLLSEPPYPNASGRSKNPNICEILTTYHSWTFEEPLILSFSNIREVLKGLNKYKLYLRQFRV